MAKKNVNNDSFYQRLVSTGLPVAYGYFDEYPDPPFLVYLGSGQDQFIADNGIYKKANTYQVEFYFTSKDESAEATLETALEGFGYFYEKSADVYVESEDIFVIYYTVSRKGYTNG